MEEDAPLLHDYSTLEGRFSLFLHRIKWKHLVPPMVFLGTFTLIAILIASIESDINSKTHLQKLTPGNSLLGKDDPNLKALLRLSNPSDVPSAEDSSESAPVPGWTVIKQPSPGVVEAEGCENGLYTFEGFDSTVPTTTSKSLRIRNLVINAEELTESLKEWTSLESIVIENVWVNGNFSRVYLPNLNKFIYHQFRNGKTDQYKQPDTLKQILFFDKSPNQTWDLERDLLNLNMSIQISIEGTKLLEIEPDTGEININTHECENMLINFDEKSSFPLSTLSLNWCPVTNLSIQTLQGSKETLKFLLLNNAVPANTQLLGEVTGALRNLRELHLFQRFHCDWLGYQIYLNVSELPPSLETLSVTNLDLSWGNLSPPFIGGNSIRNLSLDQYVGEEVVTNFPQIFPNLSTVALFNVTQNRSYALMEKVLFQMPSPPELIIVTDFSRRISSGKSLENGKWTASKSQVGTKLKSNTKAGKTVDQATLRKVEQFLSTSGVPENASSFQLELCRRNPNNNNNTLPTYYVGKELTSFQRNFFRFQRLAFRKIDTYADYVTWDAEPK